MLNNKATLVLVGVLVLAGAVGIAFANEGCANSDYCVAWDNSTQMNSDLAAVSTDPSLAAGSYFASQYTHGWWELYVKPADDLSGNTLTLNTLGVTEATVYFDGTALPETRTDAGFTAALDSSANRIAIEFVDPASSGATVSWPNSFRVVIHSDAEGDGTTWDIFGLLDGTP